MTTDVPVVVEAGNLVLSVLCLLIAIALTVRRWAIEGRVTRMFVIDIVVVLLFVVLLGGAVFQMGWLERGLWLTMRTAFMLILLAAMAALWMERDPT